MISSVSGNSVNRPCFRILLVSCDVSSTDVHWRLSSSAAIVTQLVTRSSVSMSPATHSFGVHFLAYADLDTSRSEVISSVLE